MGDKLFFLLMNFILLSSTLPAIVWGGRRSEGDKFQTMLLLIFYSHHKQFISPMLI